MKKNPAEQALLDLMGTTAAKLMEEHQVRWPAEPLPTLEDAIVDARFLMVMTGLSAEELEEISDRADDIDANPHVLGVPVIAEWTNSSEDESKENDHE